MELSFITPRTAKIPVCGNEFELTEHSGEKLLEYEGLSEYLKDIRGQKPESLEAVDIKKKLMADTYFRLHSCILPGITRKWWENSFVTRYLPDFLDAQMRQNQLNYNDEVGKEVTSLSQTDAQ